MIKRVGIAIPVWKDYDIARRVVLQAHKATEEAGFQPFICVGGSEGKDSARYFKDLPCHYIEVKNFPLSFKFQKIFYAISDFDVDVVGVIGADNFCNAATIRGLLSIMRPCPMPGLPNQARVVGLKDIYFLEGKRLFHWPGYDKESRRQGESVGPFRFLHHSLLDDMDWEVWTEATKSAIDGQMMKAVYRVDFPYLQEVVPMKQIGAIAVDIKSGNDLTPLKIFRDRGLPLHEIKNPASLLAEVGIEW